MCFQVVQGIFEAGSRLLEIEHLLNESLIENDRLRDLKKTASTRIQAAKSNHKSVEARLKTAERQVKELTAKLDREINRACKLRAKNKKLKAEVDKARAGVQKAEDTAQSYYNQGFEKVAESLKSQLAKECNKCFLQGWRSALDQAGVDDTSELYNLGPKHQPFKVGLPKEHEEEEATRGLRDPEVNEVLRDPEAA
jgi:phage shock protein A